MAATKMRDVIRQTREAKNWSQHKLATEADVSPSTVFRVEKGASDNPQSIAKIARALGLSASSLREVVDSPHVESTALAQKSPMGQMVGAMQLAAAGGVDPSMELLAVASEADDPPEVFKAIAELRYRAPPAAPFAWYVIQYLAMGGGKRLRVRS